MRKRRVWLNVIVVAIVIICSAGISTAMKADSSSELMIAVVSLSVALIALYISLRTFYSIDEVNAISRMDGNVMENPRYRPNILRAIFRFPQKDFSDTSKALMMYMNELFRNPNKQSGAHLADNVQEVADMMVLVPLFIHTNDSAQSDIHIKSVQALLNTMKHQVSNFKEISDGSCKLLDETVNLIDSIFAYQNMTGTGKSDPSKLLEIRGSLFINPVTCILYNNYLGLYLLRRATTILGRHQKGLSLREMIDSANECSVEDKSMALVYLNKASDSFIRAKENIGDDMIWKGFVCFNLARAEYLKQLLYESFGDTTDNVWEAHINESICNWMTSNKIIAEQFTTKYGADYISWLQQALISQENKVRLSKVVLQMMRHQPLSDHNGNPWLKHYSDITDTSFYKNIPDPDPQKQTDSLKEDVENLLEKNNK